jgi:hypothetical protein
MCRCQHGISNSEYSFWKGLDSFLGRGGELPSLLSVLSFPGTQIGHSNYYSCHFLKPKNNTPFSIQPKCALILLQSVQNLVNMLKTFIIHGVKRMRSKLLKRRTLILYEFEGWKNRSIGGLGSCWRPNFQNTTFHGRLCNFPQFRVNWWTADVFAYFNI